MARSTVPIVPSAAFSDFCLSTMCFAAAFVLMNTKTRLQDTNFLSAFGLTIIGTAAAVGFLRYGFFPALFDVHQLAARIATAVGMSMFTLGMSCAVSDGLLPPVAWVARVASPGGTVAVASTICTILVVSKWNSAAADIGCQIVAGGPVILLLFTSFTLGQRPALISALCVVVGAMFGLDGESWGVLNVNYFHYLLITSIGFAVLQFLKRPVL